MLKGGAGLGTLDSRQPVVGLEAGLGSEKDLPEAHALQILTPTSSFVSVCPQTGKTKEFPEGGHWRGQQGREGCPTKNSCCIGVKHSAG